MQLQMGKAFRTFDPNRRKGGLGKTMRSDEMY